MNGRHNLFGSGPPNRPRFSGDRSPFRLEVGFTLIELLVTVTIVLVLCGLSIGALSRSYESGKAAKCSNNLRQIFVAFQGYLADHEMIMPQRFYDVPVNYGYDELLMPYAGNDPALFICPSQAKRDLTDLTTHYYGEPGYGMNWYYDNMHISKVQFPSQTIMVAETQGAGGRHGSHRADRDSAAPGELANERHAGTSNYLFFDGHVERLKHEDTIRSTDFWGTDFQNHNVHVAPNFR